MARVNEKEAARDRVLSDDELRALWRVTEATPMPHGHFVRFLLLTAIRRNEAAKMVREEVSPDGTWIIPAVRMKAKQEHVVPLSPAARAILDDLPNVSRYVFTTTGFSAIRNFWSFKEKLDAEMLPALRRAAEGRGEDPGRTSVAPWVLHDLRRTARSLMSRAQVNPDIAERVLAHTIGGVRGVYDRYAYIEEKRHALKALAAMIERIVSPPAGQRRANALGRDGMTGEPGFHFEASTAEIEAALKRKDYQWLCEHVFNPALAQFLRAKHTAALVAA